MGDQLFITGLPHIVLGGRLVMVAGVFCHVVVCNTPRQACRRLHPLRWFDDVIHLQSNYSSTV